MVGRTGTGVGGGNDAIGGGVVGTVGSGWRGAVGRGGGLGGLGADGVTGGRITGRRAGWFGFRLSSALGFAVA